MNPRKGAERKPGADKLKKCDEFDISLSVVGECASDHPLTVYDVQLKARGTEKPSPKVESMRASFMSGRLSIDLRTELVGVPEPRPINVALADGADPEPPQERGSPSHVAGSIVSGVLDDLIERVVATGNKEEDSPTAPSVNSVTWSRSLTKFVTGQPGGGPLSLEQAATSASSTSGSRTRVGKRKRD